MPDEDRPRRFSDVRLALVDGSWAVRIAPDPPEALEALTLVVRRCLERLSIRNGRFVTAHEALRGAR